MRVKYKIGLHIIQGKRFKNLKTIHSTLPLCFFFFRKNDLIGVRPKPIFIILLRKQTEFGHSTRHFRFWKDGIWKRPGKRTDKIPTTIMCSCLCFCRHFLISQSVRTATRENPTVYHYFCSPLLIVRTYINDKSTKWTVYHSGIPLTVIYLFMING